VIIGCGVAGMAAVGRIRSTDPAGSIKIISEEPYPFYSRIRLPEILSGSAAAESLIIRKDIWYRERGIDLMLDTTADAVDLQSHEIITTAGSSIPFDRLLIASGSRSFVPPVPGAEKKGVFTLRSLSDALAIRGLLAGGPRRVIIIGGGVLGLEAGHHIAKGGNRVSVVEAMPRLLPRQMDPSGAALLQKQLESRGMRFLIGVQTREISGLELAEAVVLEDGTHLQCDMVLISAGVRPELALARKAGLACGRGVIVNDRMETSNAGIYAAGDVAEHNGICYGIWPAAEQQGLVAGTNMTGGNAEYHGTVVSNTLKVAGIDLFSMGDIDDEGRKESAVIKDPEGYIYRKLVFEGNTICGAILYGDLNGKNAITRAIVEHRDISDIKDRLGKGDISGL